MHAKVFTSIRRSLLLRAMQVWQLKNLLLVYNSASFSLENLCGLWLFPRAPLVWHGQDSGYSYKIPVCTNVQSDFWYSFAKVAKLCSQTTKNITVKKLDSTTQIRSVRLCARCCCIPLRSKRDDLRASSQENSHKCFVYYLAHTVMEITMLIN